MRRRARSTRTRTAFRSSTPCGSCAAVSRTLAFPPASPNEGLRDRVLDEILEERVVSSRGQKKPRGVKRKMSGYPLRGPGPLVPPQVGLDTAYASTGDDYGGSGEGLG